MRPATFQIGGVPAVKRLERRTMSTETDTLERELDRQRGLLARQEEKRWGRSTPARSRFAYASHITKTLARISRLERELGRRRGGPVDPVDEAFAYFRVKAEKGEAVLDYYDAALLYVQANDPADPTRYAEALGWEVLDTDYNLTTRIVITDRTDGRPAFPVALMRNPRRRA